MYIKWFYNKAYILHNCKIVFFLKFFVHFQTKVFSKICLLNPKKYIFLSITEVKNKYKKYINC